MRRYRGALAEVASVPEKDYVLAVDEENGSVLLRIDLGKGSPPGGNGTSLVTFEAFEICGDRIHAAEAVLKGMPADTTRGWR